MTYKGVTPHERVSLDKVIEEVPSISKNGILSCQGNDKNIKLQERVVYLQDALPYIAQWSRNRFNRF